MIVHATRIGTAVLLVAIVSSVEPTHAEQASERAKVLAYEAEQVTTYSGAGRPEHTLQSKVYQSADGSVREESPMGIKITNAKTRTIAILNPELRQAVVTLMPRGRQAPGRRPAGVAPVQAMVDGRPTLKYESLGDTQIRSRVWVDVRSGAVVFSEFSSSDTGTVTKVLRNLKEGPVPQNLFEVPGDYSQIPMELPETPPEGPKGKPLRPAPQRW
jgi:outer membrane lipoprotein-sorting protein